MILSCSDVHLICINDLWSFTVCLNLVIWEFAFISVCIASCNLSAYMFVILKIKGCLLTYSKIKNVCFER